MTEPDRSNDGEHSNAQDHVERTIDFGNSHSAGETALFKSGDRVRISERYPVGHYRVPRYVRGKQAIVESVIEPAAINNEEEGFGRNAGIKLHYCRVIIPLSELWPGYPISSNDGLHIEVCENWLDLI